MRDITSQKRAEEERVQLVREQLARATAESSERRAAFLAEVSAALAASLEYRGTLARVARMAVPFLADACIVDIAEEDGGLTRLEVALANPAKHGVAARLRAAAPRAGSPEARVLRSGEPVIVPEVRLSELLDLAAEEDYRRAMEALAPRSLMVVPIVARGRTLGALTFIAAESERRFGRSDLGLAEEVARRAGLAVENARLYKASQEARQAAEAANRAKDEFLATLSHELRTPLSPILGWVRLLRSGDLDATASARGLEVIERNVRAQTQLIEDLLDVSRIITGKLRLEVRPMDLVAVVEAGIEAVRPAAEAKGIRIESRLDPKAAAMVGDPDRLQQVVWNLVSNAVKFTPKEGRVEVELHPGRRPRPPPGDGHGQGDSGQLPPPRLRPACARRTAPARGPTAASASAWPSSGTWWSCTGARWPRRAPGTARAPCSPWSCPSRPPPARNAPLPTPRRRRGRCGSTGSG